MTFPFHSVPSKWKRTAVPCTKKTETERNRVRRQKVWPSIPIVASSNKMPEESKQAERSIVLAKRSHQEVIGIDWQRELNRLLIANIDPS